MTRKRIIFFSGKGGVGKTTIAAATALRCADRGIKTILLSTDPAHSIGDLLGLPIHSTPTPVAPNLDAVHIDPHAELDSNWGHIRDYFSNLIQTLGADGAVSGELAILPGMDNLFSLLRIRDFHDKSDYKVIIVDMAPTGESLRLLSLPQIVSLALKITRVIEKYIVSPVIRPASRMSKSLRVVVAPEDVARSWESILEKILAMRDLFEKESRTTTRLVMQPESMIMNETQRALTYLNLFGMVVDQVIINRILPDETQKGYFRAWHETQKKYIHAITRDFTPIPIAHAPFFHHEIHGLNDLRTLGNALYNQADPASVFYNSRPVQFVNTKKEKLMKLKAPFLDVQNTPVSLHRRGNEIMIEIGSFLRTHTIPDSMAALEPEGADYNNGELIIRFIKK